MLERKYRELYLLMEENGVSIQVLLFSSAKANTSIRNGT